MNSMLIVIMWITFDKFIHNNIIHMLSTTKMLITLLGFMCVFYGYPHYPQYYYYEKDFIYIKDLKDFILLGALWIKCV